MKFSNVLLLMVCGAMFGCSQGEETVKIKMEQATVIQQHIAALAAACTGKLSITSELTGEIKIPIKTIVSCDEMDNEDSFFKALSDDQLESLETTIRTVNQIEKE
ncbi:hypothetical protein [Pseudoalteromonas sp. M58]|uniref:hypothetical protein n=1 Tax=Pseudoalteromonas sp. M58 TaxID=3141534 RepID=UPI00366F6D2E